MPIRKPRTVREPEPDDTDDEDGTLARDFAMARLARVLVNLEAAREAVRDAVALFITPEDDSKGKDRDELLEMALEQAGDASRGIEAAQEAMEEADMELGEPDEEEDEEETE